MSSQGWTSLAASASPHRARAPALTTMVASSEITQTLVCLFCGGAQYWMPCCKCGLMSAKQRGINLSLTHWPCFCYHHPRCCWPSLLLGLTAGSASSRCPPNPLTSFCFVCVICKGIYWYIYFTLQNTPGKVYQQYLISWNQEDEESQGRNLDFHLQSHLWMAVQQIDKLRI